MINVHSFLFYWLGYVLSSCKISASLLVCYNMSSWFCCGNEMQPSLLVNILDYLLRYIILLAFVLILKVTRKSRVDIKDLRERFSNIWQSSNITVITKTNMGLCQVQLSTCYTWHSWAMAVCIWSIHNNTPSHEYCMLYCWYINCYTPGMSRHTWAYNYIVAVYSMHHCNNLYWRMPIVCWFIARPFSC